MARNIEQTADELGRITSITQLDTTDSPSHNALTQMVEKACQANNNTNPTKIQMIFRARNLWRQGVIRNWKRAISISELQDQLKQLSHNTKFMCICQPQKDFKDLTKAPHYYDF